MIIVYGLKNCDNCRAASKWLKEKELDYQFIDLKIDPLNKEKLEKWVNIHSLDNIKLAKKISLEQKKLNKKIKIFIQVNIGDESQKSGLAPDKVNNFLSICTKELDLEIISIGYLCFIKAESKSK